MKNSGQGKPVPCRADQKPTRPPRANRPDGALLDPSQTPLSPTLLMMARRRESTLVAVFASSRYVHPTAIQPQGDAEYAPFTFYGASKAEGEKIVRASGLETTWVLIRPTSIWGPWFGIPYRGFFDTVRKGLYVHPRGERLYKTYGYVGNVVHQIKRFLFVPAELVDGRVFYVADYQPIEIRNMAESIREAFEAPAVRDVPTTILL